MTYACLSQFLWKEGEYTLIPIRKGDMEQIRFWRNQQIDILRQKAPITPQEQEQYFMRVIEPQYHQLKPEQLLFSLLKSGICIGYGGTTHINWYAKVAEVSFMLETERSLNQQLYQGEFGVFLELLKKVAREGLHLHRLFTETYDIRPWHITVLEKHGFILEGRLREHVYIDKQYVDVLFHGYLCEEKNG